MRKTRLWTAALFGWTVASAQLAPNAPKDQPHELSSGQVAANDQDIAPYIQIARDSYPAARTRFLKGLPRGQNFFVVTRLVDDKGHWEQVFIRVSTIADGSISGIISSEIKLVAGFKNGQPYTFKESGLIDWLITKPDGSEEGNVVGKFLDTRQH